MEVLAERKDTHDRIIEVAGSVYSERYVIFTDPIRTPIRDLDELMAITWLDPETAEKIYKEYLAP